MSDPREQIPLEKSDSSTEPQKETSKDDPNPQMHNEQVRNKEAARPGQKTLDDTKTLNTEPVVETTK